MQSLNFQNAPSSDRFGHAAQTLVPYNLIVREHPRKSQELNAAYCTLTHHEEALCARRKALHLAMTLHKGAQAEAQVLCNVIAHTHCQPRNHCQGDVLQAEAAKVAGMQNKVWEQI